MGCRSNGLSQVLRLGRLLSPSLPLWEDNQCLEIRFVGPRSPGISTPHSTPRPTPPPQPLFSQENYPASHMKSNAWLGPAPLLSYSQWRWADWFHHASGGLSRCSEEALPDCQGHFQTLLKFQVHILKQTSRLASEQKAGNVLGTLMVIWA